MTLGHVVAPARLAARRRLALLIPLVVGLVVGAVFWRAGERRRTAHPPGPTPVVVEPVCTYEPPPQPPKPVPPVDAWGGLARCLRENPFQTASLATVTVADVWHYVEVEHDPVWFDEGAWWFPLSGEGSAQMPSGPYVGVPLDASARCPGSLVN